MSWNINGLTNSKLEDTDLITYLCKFDIILLYETWTNGSSDIAIDGYKSYNLFRKFQNRRAYRCSGGIAVYIKEGISNGIQIVRNHFDTIIWLKFDKDFFRTEKDIFLSCVYIWGENSCI